MTDKKLMSRTELYTKLRVSRSTIINWEKKGLPKFQRAGLHPRFSYQEVLNWLRVSKKFKEAKRRNDAKIS